MPEMTTRGPKPKRSRQGRVGEAAKAYAAEELADPRPIPDWSAALAEFTTTLRDLYGSRLDSVVLYGSRARGDAEPLSDIDTLVVLKHCEDFWAEFHRICPLADRVSLKYGIVISALPTSAARYEQAQTPLFMNIRREGKRVA